MARNSAGLLPFRRKEGRIEVLLVHPGGPFWARKDTHAWSFPKGEYGREESPLQAARREFREETGWEARGELFPLGEVRQKGGKRVTAWAFEGNFDPESLISNTFEMEWPPRSGKIQPFPEVDRAAWFPLSIARQKIHQGLLPFLDRLERILHEATGQDNPTNSSHPCSHR